jgi:hypothetical protein
MTLVLPHPVTAVQKVRKQEVQSPFCVSFFVTLGILLHGLMPGKKKGTPATGHQGP